MQKNTLTTKQSRKLENKIEKSTIPLYIIGFLALTISIVCFTVPLSFLPKRKTLNDFGIGDETQTFLESFGIIPTILFLIILFGLLFFAVLVDTKYLSLKKDLIEKKTISLTTKVKNIKKLKGDSEEIYDVYIEKNSAELNKIRYLKSEFPNLEKDNSISITLTANAKFVLETKIL